MFPNEYDDNDMLCRQCNVSNNFNINILCTLLEVKKVKSHEAERWIESYYPTIVILTMGLTVLSVIGTIGNLLVIRIFWRFMGRSGSHLFVTILAFIDLCVCLFDIPATIIWQLWKFNNVDIGCKIHTLLKAFCIPLGAVLLALIAFDRFLTICRIPSVRMGTKRALLMFLCGIVLSFGLAVPIGLHTGVMKIQSHMPGVDYKKWKPTTSSESSNRLPQNCLNIFAKMQYGLCEMDDTYIGTTQYERYSILLFSVFIIIFLVITVLYSLIFYYIYSRSRRWVRRDASDITASQTPMKPCCNLFETSSETNLAHQQLQQPPLELRATFFPYQNHPSNSIPFVEIVPHSPLSEIGHEINQNHITLSDKNQRDIQEPQRAINLLLHEDKSKVSNIAAPNSRNSPNDHSTFNNQGVLRRPLHVRTAQTLILVTVTFLLSYLPYFLIINEIIWPKVYKDKVKWPEQTPPLNLTQNISLILRDNEFFVRQNMNTSIILSNKMSNFKNIFPNHSKLALFYLYFINSAVNPVIYAFMNQEFRNNLFVYFRPCNCKL